jgi:hypothetical protein
MPMIAQRLHHIMTKMQKHVYLALQATHILICILTYVKIVEALLMTQL